MRSPSRSVRRGRVGGASRAPTDAERVLGDDEATLLDVVDNLLSKGVVLTGEVTIALADVDLVFVRLSLLLCAADRVMPGEHPDPIVRHQQRHEMRRRLGRRAAARGTKGAGRA